MEPNIEKPNSGEAEILEVYENPTSENLCGAGFMIPEYNGKELKRGEAIIFKVPDDLRNQILDNVTIHHRKDPDRATASKESWDEEGSYTRTMVWDLNTKNWITLGRDKFAEVRNPGRYETENIHDCLDFGKIKPGYFAIIGAGVGERGIVNFHGLEFNVFPENTKILKEIILTPGTEFVDIERDKKHPSYGGGVRPNMGIYKNSAPLNHPDMSNIGFNTTLSGENFYVENDIEGSTGRMHILIDEPIQIQRIEIAAGDTEDWKGKVYKIRSDGPETFRRGWALLDVYARKEDGTIIKLLENMNVPPRGILKGSPQESLNLEKGDEIIIESKNDATYVMGFRIQ